MKSIHRLVTSLLARWRALWAPYPWEAEMDAVKRRTQAAARNRRRLMREAQRLERENPT
jgi:hypothetical protein